MQEQLKEWVQGAVVYCEWICWESWEHVKENDISCDLGSPAVGLYESTFFTKSVAKPNNFLANMSVQCPARSSKFQECSHGFHLVVFFFLSWTS